MSIVCALTTSLIVTRRCKKAIAATIVMETQTSNVADTHALQMAIATLELVSTRLEL